MRLKLYILICMVLAATGALSLIPSAFAEPPALDSCTLASSALDSVDVPKNIVDLSTVDSLLEVSGQDFPIQDVDLTLNITHTFAGDLDIVLISPAGTEVTISTDNGASNDNTFAGTTFDDQAAETATDFVYNNLVVATALIPEGALSAFIGENPNGTWTLRIADDAGGDAGILNSWSLTFSSCSDNEAAAADLANAVIAPLLAITNGAPVQSNIDFSSLRGEICSISANLNITHTFAADLDITLTSPEGTVIPLTTNNGGSNDNVFAGTTFTDQAGTAAVTDATFTNGVAITAVVPEGAMGAFIGENANGTWALDVRDDAVGDDGALVSWSLLIQTCDVDSDGDGVIDLDDECPTDFAKVLAGICGCNVLDIDSDGDGSLDCLDACPADSNKTQAGACGCGVADTDSDGDGVANCNDSCSADSNKSAPGICGCGVADTDSDSDGTADCIDSCSADASKTAPGICGCGVSDADSDNSGIADCLFGAELGKQTSDIVARLNALKYSSKKPKQKLVRAEINALLGSVDALSNYILSNAGVLVFNQGSSVESTTSQSNALRKQLKLLRKKVKRSKKLFNRDKRKALTTATSLEGSIA